MSGLEMKRELRTTTSFADAMKVRSRGLWVVLVACLILGWPVAATAQDEEEFPHGEMDRDCSECHTTEGWRPLRDPVDFDHSTTGFPLKLSHDGVACTSCHEILDFSRVATACADCHFDAHRGELGFGCDSCHIPATWDNRREMWDRHSATLFPLTGTHASVDCAGCHRAAPPFEYATTPVDCFACHANDFRQTSRPDHERAGFPPECQLCHTTISWQPARIEGGLDFDHAFFPLNGGHANLDCSDCHQNGFVGTPTDCYSCHRQDYENTQDPDHVEAGFPTDCEVCHDIRSWDDAEFDHNQIFRLTGAHRSLDCEDCHSDGFQGTPTECYGCHRGDYESTDDPDHARAGFSTDCEDCHGTQTWEGAVADHDQFFRLTGAHRGLDCNDCHSGGFEGTPTDCYSCHRAEYEATTDPDHIESGFPRNCESCHGTSSWEGADVNHDLFFRLTGAHRNLDCQECHSDGFAGTPTDCWSCHRDDYNNTDDPDHREAGFPQDCEVCHDTRSWEGAEIDHDLFFRLTGAHRNLDCQECHSDGFPGTPTDCWSCHRDDYDSTDDPDHRAAGFPQDCEICHDTSSWEGGDFSEHDSLYFPIFSGRHRNEWSSCSQCHTNPGNFSVFSCFECHDRSETDDEHEDVPGYVYDSDACYECHPTGSE